MGTGKGRDRSRRKERDQPPVRRAEAAPGQHAKVLISFENYRPGNSRCLSECNKEQIRSFLDCLRKITERTWQQLFEAGAKSNKTGLNPTRYFKSDLKNPEAWPEWLGDDVSLFGVRATQRRRIFGARVENAFHVIWFDEDHGVVEG